MLFPVVWPYCHSILFLESGVQCNLSFSDKRSAFLGHYQRFKHIFKNQYHPTNSDHHLPLYTLAWEGGCRWSWRNIQKESQIPMQPVLFSNKGFSHSAISYQQSCLQKPQIISWSWQNSEIIPPFSTQLCLCLRNMLWVLIKRDVGT